jgi:hypothetical protein
MALPLIDKQDNFEVIRDQIAAILVAEIANQMQLATNAAKNPLDWKMRIFTERTNPWEQWLNLNAQTDKSPIVNVWYDNSNFDKKASNISERQESTSTFNIDCYGLGVSADNPGGGHFAGDELAAKEVQKAIRLVRNILMASENTYLQLRGLVWQRWPQSMSTFQPQIDAQQVQQVGAGRITLQVRFNEFAPQYQPETLEYVAIDVKRAEDGEIVLEADYDYTV